MRIEYPKEIVEVLEEAGVYLTYSKGVGLIFKPDTPEEIREKYIEAQKKIRELKQAAL